VWGRVPRIREINDNHTSEGQKGAFLSQFAAEYRVFPQSVVLFFRHCQNSQNQNMLSTLSEGAVVDIESAAYVEGYKICLVFSDDSVRTVDFEPFLSASLNPI
jgi:hypothetical protein